MSNVPHAVYTAEGNELGHGMTEREAREAAQRWADERGEVVDVYQGSRLVATIEPSEVA